MDKLLKLMSQQMIVSYGKNTWINFQDILGEVGKIIELDKGFMMKIGERGGQSFMICCLSNIQTPKLTRDEISWLKTLAFIQVSV